MSRYKGLEAEWDRITSAIAAAGIPTYPSTIKSDTNVAEWSHDLPFDDFLALAARLDAKVIYAEHTKLDEDDIAGLQQRVLQGPEDRSPPLLRPTFTAEAAPTSSAADFANLAAPFPELSAFVRRARAYLGRTWGMQAQWVSQGIIHSHTQLADWYEDLLDELPRLSARYNEIDLLQSQEQLEREQAADERRARHLAEVPEFHKAHNSYAAQNQLAVKEFPDASLNEVRNLVRAARQIYVAELLPKREEELAHRARHLAAMPEFHKARKTYAAQSQLAVKEFADVSPNECRDLVRVARQIYDAEVLPEREQESVHRARSLMEDGLSLTRTAGKLGITAGSLERLLSRYEGED